jgi:hypothetical protein
MADEGPPVLAYDESPAGLLDDPPAAGFDVLAPLRAQLLDIAGHAGSGAGAALPLARLPATELLLLPRLHL